MVMQTFSPPQIPQDAPESIKAYLRQLHAAIARAAANPDTYSSQKYLHAEPARVEAGMEVLADGTDWNPGSGAGRYRRNEANTAWVYLG
jgi:hypothetical protein